ncbi:MAG TPA: hypothetical protein VLH10_28475 [Yinghuangia sp.]|nr:hypothetical protein [Yinghuangia sp.]
MSSSLTRVTGRAPALAAGLLVLAAAVPATAYAAESAPASALTPASAANESDAEGAWSDNGPKDGAEAESAESAESAEAEAAAESGEAADAAEAAESSESAASGESTESTESPDSEESSESSGSGYWDSLGSTESDESSESPESAESSGSGYWDATGSDDAAASGNDAVAPEAGASAESTHAPAEPTAPTPSPIQGRTEGGSIILTNGDIVACAAVGDLRIAGAEGREYLTNGPGTHFTTAAGTDVQTLSTGHVRVTVGGASAEIQCGPEGFPTVVGLPRTGASVDAAMLALAGLGLVAAGGTVVVATRRPRRLGAA